MSQQPPQPIKAEKNDPSGRIFTDFESKSNIIGLFDLLLKIDRRNNPELYKQKNND
ncbi:MAG: hypothetical protein WC495_01575 [Patescibacteria group bacterium]|jgi:hypothetical protein